MDWLYFTLGIAAGGLLGYCSFFLYRFFVSLFSAPR